MKAKFLQFRDGIRGAIQMRADMLVKPPIDHKAIMLRRRQISRAAEEIAISEILELSRRNNADACSSG